MRRHTWFFDVTLGAQLAKQGTRTSWAGFFLHLCMSRWHCGKARLVWPGWEWLPGKGRLVSLVPPQAIPLPPYYCPCTCTPSYASKCILRVYSIRIICDCKASYCAGRLYLFWSCKTQSASWWLLPPCLHLQITFLRLCRDLQDSVLPSLALRISFRGSSPIWLLHAVWPLLPLQPTISSA